MTKMDQPNCITVSIKSILHTLGPLYALTLLMVFGLCSSSFAFTRTVFVEPIEYYGGVGAGLAIDDDDSLYIAENNGPPYASFVSKVDQTGVKTIVVPPGYVAKVAGLALDASGNLFVADGPYGGIHKIWRVSPAGKIETFIPFVDSPTGLAFDSVGNLYVSTFSGIQGASKITKYGPDGVEKGIAAGGFFHGTMGIAIDRHDNLYLVDDRTIYKVTPFGEHSVYATVNEGSLYNIAIDVNDNIWATCYNALKVAKVSPNRQVEYYPGGLTAIDAPGGIVLDSKGNMFVAVNGGRSTVKPAILRISGLAAPGLRTFGDSDGDGVPNGTDACQNTPAGVVVDAKGCEVTQCFTQDQLNIAVQNAVAAKDTLIAEKEAQIAEKDQTISGLNYDVNALIAAVASKDSLIQQKEQIITALNANIADLKASIDRFKQEITDLNVTISTLNAAIAAKDLTINDLNSKIAIMYTKAQLDQAVLEARAAAREADMTAISANLGNLFGIPGFMLPGANVAEQINNLSNAIGSLPKGQIDKLKQLLMP